jgi:hypothetical protein
MRLENIICGGGLNRIGRGWSCYGDKVRNAVCRERVAAPCAAMLTVIVWSTIPRSVTPFVPLRFSVSVVNPFPANWLNRFVAFAPMLAPISDLRCGVATVVFQVRAEPLTVIVSPSAGVFVTVIVAVMSEPA